VVPSFYSLSEYPWYPVVAEVGLAVVLLIGSGLLIRSFAALKGEDPGFLTEDRLVFSTPLPAAKYGTAEDLMVFYDATLAGIGAVPGVEAVAMASMLPISGYDEVWSFNIEGRPYSGPADDIGALFYRVSPGYFDAMGIPLVAGRDFTSLDRSEGPEVIAVSQGFVDQHYPGESPIGRRIRSGTDDDDPWMEIVAVVGDVQHYNLGQSSIPQTYAPYAQRPDRSMDFIVRAGVPPLSLVGGMREVVDGVDPDQPLVGITAADDMVSESISMPRFRTLLMTGFGLTALLLALVGLYGVMAYSVSQRSKEIGVRMALGASRNSVLKLVFQEGLPLVGIGLAVGLVGAFALSRILESMLFGVGVRDLGVFASVPLLLLTVALAAMLIPARRATQVDPVKTLGEE